MSTTHTHQSPVHVVDNNIPFKVYHSPSLMKIESHQHINHEVRRHNNKTIRTKNPSHSQIIYFKGNHVTVKFKIQEARTND